MSERDVPHLVRELARSPKLMAELRTFLAARRPRIPRLYDTHDQPVPQRLIDTVLHAPMALPQKRERPPSGSNF